ncbi:MAG: beta-N-acetylhexosaminidase [Clostridia bacterium]|nr:beta-N-acetylhexosaminidase [Clostridia bacterium]
MKKFKNLGIMIDMSRNAVMSVEALKKFFVYLAKMGYKRVMLYTEDTYEVAEEPYLGYMRGRYTKEELKELDSYAYELGLDLIPCIQVLAHFDAFVRWGKLPVDSDVTMMVDEPRSYEFIENCIKTCRECFRSRYIHMGMDEAFGLGKGRHLKKYGYEPPIDMFRRHLKRVNEIAKKYDFSPLMFTDMLFSLTTETYTQPEGKMPEILKSVIPDGVSPVYWEYYYRGDRQWVYEGMLENCKQFSDNVWFAGGAWTWCGLLPNNDFSIESTTLALNACRLKKIENVYICLWGDDGGECSRYGVLPTLYKFAQMANGNYDEEKIRRVFRRIFGAEYDAFMSLDKLNYLIKDWTYYDGVPKMALYNDYFCGFLDIRLLEGQREYIQGVAAEWHGYAKKYRKYACLFEAAACLADVLAIKYDLGMLTRAAYKAGDKETLRRLANEDYVSVKKRIERYALAFEKQWENENKTFGFEVQHARLGGLAMRTDACRRHLLDYVNGKIDKIEELEAELLPLERGNVRFFYSGIFTACRT